MLLPYSLMNFSCGSQQALPSCMQFGCRRVCDVTLLPTLAIATLKTANTATTPRNEGSQLRCEAVYGEEVVWTIAVTKHCQIRVDRVYCEQHSVHGVYMELNINILILEHCRLQGTFLG